MCFLLNPLESVTESNQLPICCNATPLSSFIVYFCLNFMICRRPFRERRNAILNIHVITFQVSTTFKKKFLKKQYSWASFRFFSPPRMQHSVREGDILSASVKRVRNQMFTYHFCGTFC